MSDSIQNAMYYGLNPCFDRLYAESKLNHEFVHLMDEICNRENILLAYRNIKRNDGSVTPGVDGMTIDHLENLTVDSLVTMAQNKFKWYIPRPVRRVEIPKPYDPSKTRPLGIPCLIDRLCQQCIRQILDPVAEAKFYKNSFGFRSNRDCEDAISVAMYHMNIGKLHFVADVDIHAFFDCVDHGLLMRQLWRMGVHDKSLLSIIYSMLKAPVILPDGTKIFPQRGTPQGGILSPLLANIVLNDLDWWIAKQWEDHPDIEGLKDSNKWTKLRKKGVREVHIVRYADDFKLFCRTRNDAITLLQDASEWLMANLHLETSPEKSGVTNLKRNYTEFLGLEIKVRNKKAELSPNASNRQRTWVTTSRIKPKALPRIKAKLESAMLPLRNTSDSTAPEAVGYYNSVVDGIQNYYSMATQISKDLSKLQKDITVQMHNQIKGISHDKPEKIRSQRKTDVRFMSSKQTLYLHGCMIHPIGVVQTRICRMPKRELCSYTAAGRSMLKVKTGVSEFLLAWLARHNPPDMPVEMADNSISAFSAQKCLCAILHIPLAANQAVVTCKDPNQKIRPYRFNNILLISPVAKLIICEPNVMLAKQYLSSFKVSKKQRQTINKYRALRNLRAL